MAYMKKFDEAALKAHEARLTLPEGRLKVVMDTDCYNEVDDQYAMSYMLLTPERFDVQAVYAAPFKNNRADNPKLGMELSYNEILEILKRLNISPEGFAFKGSDIFLESIDKPCVSPAALDLIDRVMKSEETLYVIALGAITNIASAIALKPEIMEKIVVVWLGGNALYWETTKEFNLAEDVVSARYLFGCGVPVVQIPCFGVTSHLYATLADLKEYIGGKNALCDLLIDRFQHYAADHTGYAKQLWDVGAVAYLINPKWFTLELAKSPGIDDQLKWILGAFEHKMITCNYLNRNAIFKDMYKKLITA